MHVVGRCSYHKNWTIEKSISRNDSRTLATYFKFPQKFQNISLIFKYPLDIQSYHIHHTQPRMQAMCTGLHILIRIRAFINKILGQSLLARMDLREFRWFALCPNFSSSQSLKLSLQTIDRAKNYENQLNPVPVVLRGGTCESLCESWKKYFQEDTVTFESREFIKNQN